MPACPEPAPVSSAEEYDRRFNDAVTEYMAFLSDREILTVTPDLDPALRARIGKYRPGPREFFSEVDYRDPEVMRTHGYHWFDKAQLAHGPTRARSGARRFSTTSSTRARRATPPDGKS